MKEIIIPELEAAMKTYKPQKKHWDDHDIAVLKRYYGKVPISQLAGTLHRTPTAIRQQAERIGL